MAIILAVCCTLAMIMCVIMRVIFRFGVEADPEKLTTVVIANPRADN